MVTRLDKKGRERCSYYIGGGCHCEHTATHREGSEPRCGTHSREAVARRKSRFSERMASMRAMRERGEALWRARAEVVEQAKHWRTDTPGARQRSCENWLAAAVDALLALESSQ